MKTTEQQIKVRACQIENIKNPEWGKFGVMEDCGMWYEIRGNGGTRTLSKSEANRFWRVAK
jgi:hypothetical protein